VLVPLFVLSKDADLGIKNITDYMQRRTAESKIHLNWFNFRMRKKRKDHRNDDTTGNETDGKGRKEYRR
jgi:hypothetical protein